MQTWTESRLWNTKSISAFLQASGCHRLRIGLFTNCPKGNIQAD
uniref:Uncharacterized protein n=1 Tax=Rhizophora mucronata TaxID=61149 RepID=A0A2P2QM53_RHIMU